MKYNSNKRKKYVEKYLSGKKSKLRFVSSILFLIGACLVAYSILGDLDTKIQKIVLIVGLIISVVFLFVAVLSFMHKTNPIKEKQYELLVKEDRFLAYEKIVETLNISLKELSDIQPILIFSPAWNFAIPNKTVYSKKYKKDHYLLEQFQSLTFGKKTVHLYTNVINHATGSFYENKVVEFSYDSIVSVETRFSVEKLIKNYREVLFLEITLNSSKVINVILRERIIDSPLLENDKLSDSEQEIIKNIKKAIRTSRK